MPVHSYRTRLIIYSLILIIFLTGTLMYSYRYVHDVIRSESRTHINRMIQLFNGHLEAERDELQRYSTIVSDDLRVKEYMFVVAEIGGASSPLTTLYDRIFGWLPIDRRVIVASDGRILVGKNHQDLANEILIHKDLFVRGIFHFASDNGLEVVAMTPITYRNQSLGYVAVTRKIDIEWLNKHRRSTGGDFFLVQESKIGANTLGLPFGEDFSPNNKPLLINSELYKLFKIALPGHTTDLPDLWFGVSESNLFNRLEKHRQFTFTLIGFGIAAIILVGLAMIRNFSRPLAQLIRITGEVANGRLPKLHKSKALNEIDELSNHFADMLKALRDKQLEIDKTHAALEKTAITDSLTNLYNRRYLQEIYPKLSAQAQRENSCLFAMLFDIDHFKKINDTHGHVIGDKCLIQFAEILTRQSRANDYLFRMGGEEFLILTVGESINDTATFADKLRKSVEQHIVANENYKIAMTVSCGVCCAKPVAAELSSQTLTQMLSQTDIALYRAKDEGRNQVCIFNGGDGSCLKTCKHKNNRQLHVIHAQ